MRFLLIIPGILLFLLIVVSGSSAQTPLWTHPSSHQSTTDGVVDLAIARNGANVAVAGANLIILNRSGAELGTSLHANSIAMGADGARIAAAMDDGLHVLFPNGTLRWSRGTEPITRVAVSSDGATFAIGDADGSLQVFNVTGTRIGSAPISRKQFMPILDLAVSGNGSVIAATITDGLNLYTKSGKVRWKTEFERPSALALAANGTRVVIGGPNSVRIYNATNTSIEVIGRYTTGGKVDSLATSMDGTRTVVGSEDNRVTFLNETGGVIWSSPTGDWVNQVALSENASVIAAGSMDKKLKVFSPNGTLLWEYTLLSWPTALAVSGDGRYIGVGCEDGTSYLFSTALTPDKTVTVKKTVAPAKNLTGKTIDQSPAKNQASNNSTGVQAAENGTGLTGLKSPAPEPIGMLAVMGLAALAFRRRL